MDKAPQPQLPSDAAQQLGGATIGQLDNKGVFHKAVIKCDNDPDSGILKDKSLA